MRKEQEEAFWQTIKAFDEIGLLRHVMIIGSWAEYLFPPLFKTDFMPNLRTRDVDFFYRNINIPKEKINVVQKLKSIGYEKVNFSTVRKYPKFLSSYRNNC